MIGDLPEQQWHGVWVPAFAGRRRVCRPPRHDPHLRSGPSPPSPRSCWIRPLKLWLLFVFDIARRGAVKVTPFFDLVLAWNVGISFGWFQSDSQGVQVILMLIKAAAVVVLAIWMARSHTLLATVALGLIIGGAIGNGIDRFAYGAVLILPCSISISAEKPIIGTCLTLPTWRLLPGLRPCCMIPS